MTMNMIKHACTRGAEAARGLARKLILGAAGVFSADALLTFRRRVAVGAATVALASSSLLIAQPAAADTTYPVSVTFDNVRFTMVSDACIFDISTLHCYSDPWQEVYGTVGAYSTAGASSAVGGLPYRIFGKWNSHPCDSNWEDTSGMTCTKRMTEGVLYAFTKVFLCGGSYYQSCSTGYSKSNNTIQLRVRPGEQFKVTVAMQDYDSGSANDNVCNAHVWFGPYTAAELQAKKFVTDSYYKPLNMGYNGEAECFVGYRLS
jgi:hypothetical protein